jgi:hypothetical protein
MESLSRKEWMGSRSIYSLLNLNILILSRATFDLIFIIKENLTLDAIYWLWCSITPLEGTGTKKDTFELPHKIFPIKKWIRWFIWQMMLCKNMVRIMESIRLETKFHILNFSNTLMVWMVKTLWRISFHRWENWQRMLCMQPRES